MVPYENYSITVSYFTHSNNIQVAVWNYESLIAKTFDGNTLKMKAANSYLGNKEQKTMSIVFPKSKSLFGFARPFFTCPMEHSSKFGGLKNPPR